MIDDRGEFLSCIIKTFKEEGFSDDVICYLREICAEELSDKIVLKKDVD